MARSAEPAPGRRSEVTSRSIDTEGSPASIFATRDWLEWSRSASWTCEGPFLFRRSRSLRLRGQFQFNQRGIGFREPRKLFHRPHSPSGCFPSGTFTLSHDYFPVPPRRS
jgi:hypothetical protein